MKYQTERCTYCRELTRGSCDCEGAELERENDKLKEVLREICLGQQPMDYGKWDVTVNRLQSIAHDALNSVGLNHKL